MQGTKPHVLIVEDEANWRDLLSQALVEQCEVETAVEFEEAERKLREWLFDVVSIDISLIEGDPRDEQGMGLFRLIHDLDESIQTVVVTGYPTVKTAKEALRGFEAFDYLLKWPEDDTAFDDLAYRDTILKAAEKARIARGPALRGSELASMLNLDLDAMLQAFVPQDSTLTKDQRRDFEFEANALVTNLFTDIQPLTPHPSGAKVIKGRQGDQVIQAVYWSKALGCALKVQFGNRKDMTPEASTANLQGVAVLLDDVSFEEFARPESEEE